jgi:hypothetical protein
MEILIFSGEKFKLVERGRNGREMAYGKRIGTGGVSGGFRRNGRQSARKRRIRPGAAVRLVEKISVRRNFR